MRRDGTSNSDAGVMVLVGILTLAAVLRLVGLNDSLWHDEIHTILSSIRQPISTVTSDLSEMNNHIFYSLQAKAVIAIAGEHNWTVRLPALIFGVLSIGAMWVLTRRVASTSLAHVVAVLLAISYHHVWFSQNARGYTEILFWYVLATIMFLEGVREPRWRLWLGYGVVVAAALYTHLTAAFFVAAHGLTYVIMLIARYVPRVRLPSNLRAPSHISDQVVPLLGFACGALVTLILYWPILSQLALTVSTVADTSEVDVMKEYQSPIWAAVEILRSVAVPSLLTSGVALIAITLTVIGAVGIGRRVPALPLILAIHVFVTLFTLLALSMRIWPRFFFIDIGFILLFITNGVLISCNILSDFAKRWFSLPINRDHLFLLASMLMFIVSVPLLLRNYEHPKQDYEGTLDYVNKVRGTSDVVVTFGLAAAAFDQYYGTDWITIESQRHLEEIDGRFERTWIVIAFPNRTKRKYPDLAAHLERRYVLNKTFEGTLNQGALQVYVSM